MPSNNPAEQSVQFLKGVGEKRALLYAKLGVHSCLDLLEYYPRAYLDFSSPYPIQKAPNGEVCAVKASVVKKSAEQRIRKGLSVFKVIVTDMINDMTVTFFNTKYTVDALKEGEEYIFYGKINSTLTKFEMSSPMVFPADAEDTFSPIYPLTQGITSKVIASNVKNAIEKFISDIPETLPEEIRREYMLPQKQYAVKNIHFPADTNALQNARRRLIFEELFTLSLALSTVKSENSSRSSLKFSQYDISEFTSSLPFSLTNAQKRVIKEACDDMVFSKKPMNRLVQGDVGSGKTAVAAACMWFSFKNGYQSVMMAPTEILAEQHYRTLSGMLSPFGINVSLLTGSMTAKQKRLVKESIASSDTDIVVGTHALIENSVEFKNLGLVITDEQHRFGVAQRMALTQKGQNPNVMVMSATPIPRTLAYIIYGDLELSVIDEMPKDRIPIKTYLISTEKQKRAYGFIKKHIDAGRQAYIVCPLVENSEIDDSLKSAVDYAKTLNETEFSGYTVGCLHGKMKPAEKERVMQDFKDNKIQLLVSTTVVEVGVDVPNAVIMMIQNAERFGLSQLHQLRGRVGRGSFESFCILVSDSHSRQTIERLKMICSSSDGFKISEFDLKLRGPGDFFGYRQHGLPTLKIADMLSDINLLEKAQNAARELLSHDPELKKPSNAELKKAVEKMLSFSA